MWFHWLTPVQAVLDKLTTGGEANTWENKRAIESVILAVCTTEITRKPSHYWCFLLVTPEVLTQRENVCPQQIIWSHFSKRKKMKEHKRCDWEAPIQSIKFSFIHRKEPLVKERKKPVFLIKYPPWWKRQIKQFFLEVRDKRLSGMHNIFFFIVYHVYFFQTSRVVII